MQGRKKRVNYRVEVFVPDGGEDFQSHSLIFDLAGTDIMGSTINSDVVTTSHQSRRKVLGKGFEPAVVGWNAPCSENCNTHTTELKRRARTIHIKPQKQLVSRAPKNLASKFIIFAPLVHKPAKSVAR